MKEKLKNEKGITLIALIISIIVMLILAAVSINIIMNQGIMTKSKDAVDRYNQKAEEEQGELTLMESLISKYKSTTSSNGEYWELTDEEKEEIDAAGQHIENEDSDIYSVVYYELGEGGVSIFETDIKSNTGNLKQIAVYYAFENEAGSYIIINTDATEEGIIANKWYQEIAEDSGPVYIEYNGEFPIDISGIPEESIYSKTYLKRLVENFNK